MNPLFSSDPVERLLAAIDVRPPIPLPAWVRCPSKTTSWDYPVRMTEAALEKLPTCHERHIGSILHHDVFAVRDGGVTWAIGWVTWRSAPLEGPRRRAPKGMVAHVIYRPVRIAPTLADLEREMLAKRAARQGAAA